MKKNHNSYIGVILEFALIIYPLTMFALMCDQVLGEDRSVGSWIYIGFLGVYTVAYLTYKDKKGDD